MEQISDRVTDAITHDYKVTPVAPEWPIAVVLLGLAITPAWVVMLVWFLYHWIMWQLSPGLN